MRERRIVVTAAMYDGHLAVLVEAFEARRAAVEPKVVIEPEKFVGAKSDIGTVAVIRVVAIRYDGVQAIVSTGKFENHEDLPVVGSLGRKRFGGPSKEGRGTENRVHGADAESGHAGPQQVASVQFVSKQIVLLHVDPLRQLVFGLAHDQVQYQPERVFHVACRGHDIGSPQIVVEELDQ